MAAFTTVKKVDEIKDNYIEFTICAARNYRLKFVNPQVNRVNVIILIFPLGIQSLLDQKCYRLPLLDLHVHVSMCDVCFFLLVLSYLFDISRLHDGHYTFLLYVALYLRTCAVIFLRCIIYLHEASCRTIVCIIWFFALMVS